GRRGTAVNPSLAVPVSRTGAASWRQPASATSRLTASASRAILGSPAGGNPEDGRFVSRSRRRRRSGPHAQCAPDRALDPVRPRRRAGEPAHGERNYRARFTRCVSSHRRVRGIARGGARAHFLERARGCVGRRAVSGRAPQAPAMTRPSALPCGWRPQINNRDAANQKSSLAIPRQRLSIGTIQFGGAGVSGRVTKSADTDVTSAGEVDERAFRDAMSRFATGVAVATTIDHRGAPVGVTISSMASLSLDPPLVLWNMALRAYSLAAFRRAGVFADRKSVV